MYKSLLTAAPAALLVGCAAFPSQVQNPPATTLSNPTTFLATGDGGSSVPTVTNPLLAAKQAEAFARIWRAASKELGFERDVLNNGQFGLVVAGVYNTVRNSMPAGKWGLAGAGGVGLLADRYQIEAQALAYRQGAEVMECVRASIEMVPKTVWDQYDTASGELQMDASNLQGVGIEKAQEAYESLTTLLPAIYTSMSTISSAVSDNVSSKTVRVPKADDIANAVKAQQLTAKDAEEKAKALQQASQPGANTEAANEQLQALQKSAALAEEDVRRADRNIAAITQAQPILKSTSQRIAAEKAKLKSKPVDLTAFEVAEGSLNEQRSLKATAIEAKLRADDLIVNLVNRPALVVAKVSTSFPSKPAIELALKLPTALKTCEAKLPK